MGMDKLRPLQVRVYVQLPFTDEAELAGLFGEVPVPFELVVEPQSGLEYARFLLECWTIHVNRTGGINPELVTLSQENGLERGVTRARLELLLLTKSLMVLLAALPAGQLRSHLDRQCCASVFNSAIMVTNCSYAGPYGEGFSAFPSSPTSKRAASVSSLHSAPLGGGPAARGSVSLRDIRIDEWPGTSVFLLEHPLFRLNVSCSYRPFMISDIIGRCVALRQASGLAGGAYGVGDGEHEAPGIWPAATKEQEIQEKARTALHVLSKLNEKYLLMNDADTCPCDAVMEPTSDDHLKGQYHHTFMQLYSRHELSKTYHEAFCSSGTAKQ